MTGAVNTTLWILNQLYDMSETCREIMLNWVLPQGCTTDTWLCSVNMVTALSSSMNRCDMILFSPGIWYIMHGVLHVPIRACCTLLGCTIFNSCSQNKLKLFDKCIFFHVLHSHSQYNFAYKSTGSNYGHGFNGLKLLGCNFQTF